MRSCKFSSIPGVRAKYIDVVAHAPIASFLPGDTTLSMYAVDRRILVNFLGKILKIVKNHSFYLHFNAFLLRVLFALIFTELPRKPQIDVDHASLP